MNFKNLSEVSDYVNERVKVENLTVENYISTENMLPNKGGIDKATKLPAAKTTSLYSKGDILLSNIRTYFKKIWYTEKDGGCSNDVLVVRARGEIEPKFLYYVLSNDKFFEYSSATSKGTKMPRGDKSAIMQYQIPDMPLEEQRTIVSVLSALDDRIAENKKINHHLEQMARAIFDDMFPNVTSGDHTIGEYITPKRGKGLLSKNAVPGPIPVIAGGLQPATYHNVSNTKAPVLTISASGANSGYIGLWNTPVWSSDSSFIDVDMTKDVYFWYVMLSKRQQEIYDMQTGSAQPHIYPKHISIMPTIELSQSQIDEYSRVVTPLFDEIGANKLENKQLEDTRDTLLPKLMSGEISVTG
ncbi:restriction endonuclease subunit S [Enterococcus avium]|uniref:restriction endonuclease subunit S n=1 Tax=Enterococcus avium TaxID=33945 RepID=UPI00288E5EFF|nr:restriction endonuclease subunit S [Enterococcus avium]MDT2482506.1 restriction endonuclease subunit S [Enterococcus avium]